MDVTKLSKEVQRDLDQPSLVLRLCYRAIVSGAYYSGKLEQMRRQQREEGTPPWTVLRYLHVCDPAKRFYPIVRTEFVRPKTFEMHLRFLRQECNVISLTELSRLIEGNKEIPEKTVAVTFDYGFLDFYEHAFPLLLKYQIPATVFVPTAFIGTDNIRWSDKVAGAMFLLKAHNYDFPNFPALDENFKKLLNETDQPSEIDLPQIALLTETMKRLDPLKRFEIMAQLGKMVDQLGGIPRETHFMSWEQLRDIQQQGIEIGIMGHGHKVYTEISEDERKDDITAAIDAFDSQKMRFARLFAFPEGEISREARDLLFLGGFRFSCGIGKYPMPKKRQKTSTIIGRLQMFQSNTFCKEFYAARIWQIEALENML